MTALESFMVQSWVFKNDKFMSLNDILLDEDRKEFYFERHNLDLEYLYVVTLKGGQKYLLKQSDDPVSTARRKQKAKM